MSVLLHDAVSALGPDAKREYERGELADVVYADDTLLMGTDEKLLTGYLHAIAAAGKRYGMRHGAALGKISSVANTMHATRHHSRRHAASAQNKNGISRHYLDGGFAPHA